MTTNFNIAQLKRNPSNGLVVEVVYILNFNHEGESDRHVGFLNLNGDPTDPAFIPFENLTEEIVINWVKADLGEEKIAKIEAEYLARLQDVVEKKNNPTELLGTPW